MGDLEKQEKESLLEGTTAVLDFDVLCSTVALQSHGKWGNLGSVGDEEDKEEDEEEEDVGAVLRMWEGEVLDCFDDYGVALESTCCPCYQFAKNVKRAGFGSSYIQAYLNCFRILRPYLLGLVYFLLAMSAFVNLIIFIATRRYCFLYLAIVFLIAVGTYLGFFRTRLRKKFNIKDSDSSLDDCLYHLICPCCTLCQESRTLEMNNVEDGTWHGRGDTICIRGSRENIALLGLSPPPLASIKSSDE